MRILRSACVSRKPLKLVHVRAVQSRLRHAAQITLHSNFDSVTSRLERGSNLEPPLGYLRLSIRILEADNRILFSKVLRNNL